MSAINTLQMKNERQSDPLVTPSVRGYVGNDGQTRRVGFVRRPSDDGGRAPRQEQGVSRQVLTDHEQACTETCASTGTCTETCRAGTGGQLATDGGCGRQCK
jgi:hypothetical protein